LYPRRACPAAKLLSTEISNMTEAPEKPGVLGDRSGQADFVPAHQS